MVLDTVPPFISRSARKQIRQHSWDSKPEKEGRMHTSCADAALLSSGQWEEGRHCIFSTLHRLMLSANLEEPSGYTLKMLKSFGIGCLGCHFCLQSCGIVEFALADALSSLSFCLLRITRRFTYLNHSAFYQNALNFNQVRQAARVPEIGGLWGGKLGLHL